MSNPLIATPIVVEDFPRFLDSLDVSPEATRYLFFPGDVLASRRRQEMRDLTALGMRLNEKAFHPVVNGGEEFQSPCLARTKGFVPRAFITPVEIGAYWVPNELVGSFVPTFKGVVDVEAKGAKTLVGEKMYPGHAVNWILSSAANDQGYKRGVTEIESLRGENWDTGAAMEAQMLYFPTYPSLPPTLRELESGIRQRAANLQGDLKFIGEQMLAACDEFRSWGLMRLQIEHSLVKAGTLPTGFAHSYSELARSLMEQLEITPQDQQLQALTQAQSNFAEMLQAKQSDVMPMLEAILTKNDATALAVAEAMKDALGKLADRLGTQPAPVAATPEIKTTKTAKPAAA